jgi:hypothetical protein
MSGVHRTGRDTVSLSAMKRITVPYQPYQESLGLSPATHLSSHQRRVLRAGQTARTHQQEFRISLTINEFRSIVA